MEPGSVAGSLTFARGGEKLLVVETVPALRGRGGSSKPAQAW